MPEFDEFNGLEELIFGERDFSEEDFDNLGEFNDEDLDDEFGL